MKLWKLGLSGALLAAGVSLVFGAKFPPTAALTLRDAGPAPELTNTVWLNTAGPLRLANLRGKVVALDMWTFG
jgi:hypothetical protein